MKELSIEEKAKAYDKAIERAKQHCADYVVETIFPELKESEDEKIRKWIINEIKIKHNNLDEDNVDFVDKAIAWLEKQGEPTEINPSKFDSQLNRLLKQFESLPKEDLTSSLSFYLNVVQNDGTYKEEKQGEQKPFDYENANIQSKDFAPKVEPKFREGEWIIHHGTENIYQVIAIIDNQYQLKYGDNYTVQKCADVDRCARLWDITQDAKPGDVLAFDNDTIVIFKDLYNSTMFHSYCYFEYDIFDFSKDELPDGWESEGFKPATKEQRDLMFQKMKEAGYEWDANKKELKKIEQKLTWSEEDEVFVHGLIRGLSAKRDIHGHTTFSSDCIDITETINWLKSLKDRYIWKPSDEQMKALGVMTITGGMPYYAGQKLELINLYNDLKKLKG